MNILIVGGLGYIGIRLVRQLIKKYPLVIVDYSTDHRNYNLITAEYGYIPLYTTNISNKQAISSIFSDHSIHIVIYLAGMKSVVECEDDPLKCYENNINATINLLSVMKQYDCKRFIYASSATVYSPGFNKSENELPQPSTIYGRSKVIMEGILADLNAQDWKCVTLRYFNPVGDSNLHLDPAGNNLNDKIINIRRRTSNYDNDDIVPKNPLRIYGNDHDTIDGTPIRDYIHIEDLVDATKIIIEQFEFLEHSIYNIGTGVSTSVLQLFQALSIDYIIQPRRAVDISVHTADISRIRELGWSPQRDIIQALSL